MERAVVGAAVDIDQLSLSRTLEHVFVDEHRLEIRDAQFLAHLAPQGLLGRLAERHVPAYGRVPLAGLDVLPRRALLQIELACRVEDMQMHDGVQQLAAAVALAARGRARRPSLHVYYGEHLFLIIHVLEC